LDAKIPKRTLMVPPVKLNTSDSIRNWKRISLVFAPTAIRIPISLVRSVTDTSYPYSTYNKGDCQDNGHHPCTGGGILNVGHTAILIMEFANNI